MHCHGRCIKVVYAREEDHPLLDLAGVSPFLSRATTDYEGSKTFKSITSRVAFVPRGPVLRSPGENCFPLFVGKINRVSTPRLNIA